tara:strand:- start:1450 stop:1668 length:219 start_codon:yes stop_codon:yes gene_type:complete
MMMMMIMEKKALYLMTHTTWEYTQTPCSRALGIYLSLRERRRRRRRRRRRQQQQQQQHHRRRRRRKVVQTKG